MNELREYFGREVPRIDAYLEQEVEGLEGLVRDVANVVLLAPGKRLRPLMTILAARGLGYHAEDVYGLACSLEMLHSATLLHDDILDDADLRRGRDSAHVVFGVKETILAGDALLALANKLGSGYGNARLSYHLAEGIMDTAVGEIREIAAIETPSASREVYLDIITGKTACLIRTSCLLGALLAGADEEQEAAAAGFGLDVGIAFQLVDDALDYESSSSAIGKPAGGDLLEGKVTWPLILYLESMSESERDALLGALRMNTLTPDEVREIVGKVREKGYAEDTRRYAADHVERARNHLAVFPDSLEKTVLEQAAGFVLTRTK